MIDFDSLPEEYDPLWAVNPERPILGNVRRGIFYRDLEPETLKLFWSSGAKLQLAVGALGSHLFYGRTNGPFVPYDRTIVDQNENRKVSQRPWPWCWGDEVWTLSEYYEQSLVFHFEKEGCSLLLIKPGVEVRRSLLKWAQKKVGEVPLQDLPVKQFLGL